MVQRDVLNRSKFPVLKLVILDHGTRLRYIYNHILDKVFKVHVDGRVFRIEFEHRVELFHCRIVVRIGFDSFLLRTRINRSCEKISYAEIGQHVDDCMRNL